MTQYERKHNKYDMEKVIHEFIRDLPEARKIENLFHKGYITAEEALRELADEIERERKHES